MNISTITKILKEIISSGLSQENLITWEKIPNGYKYIVVLYNYVLSPGTNPILYNKLLFVTNEDKTELLKNIIYYQYDMPCVFRTMQFNNEEELKSSLLKILKSDSNSPFTLLNTKFNEMTKNINDILISNNTETISTLIPVVPDTIISCNDLTFDFVCNILSNNEEINIKIIPQKDITYKINAIYKKQEISILAKTVNDINNTIASCILKLIQK